MSFYNMDNLQVVRDRLCDKNGYALLDVTGMSEEQIDEIKRRICITYNIGVEHGKTQLRHEFKKLIGF